MYSTEGGDATVIGALLILGRKCYGLLSEFAIARHTEALIGLPWFIIIVHVKQPSRAVTLAKSQLYMWFEALKVALNLLTWILGRSMAY